MTAIAWTFCGTVIAGAVADVTTDLSWKDISAGGAAVMVIGVVVIFLRNNDATRRENSETTKDIAAKFADTVRHGQEQARVLAEQFGETTAIVLKESRERESANIQQVASLIKEIHQRSNP